MSDLITMAIYIMAYLVVIGLVGLGVTGRIQHVDVIQTILLVDLVMIIWDKCRKKE